MSTNAKKTNPINTEKKKAPKYKVTNWSEYNKSLINRGNLTVWVDKEVDKTWLDNKSGKRGRSNFYSDQTIELFLTVRLLFHLPLRQTQGLMIWILKQMGFSLPVPNYSQVSRRAKKLNISLASKLKKFQKEKNGPIHLLVDSTGLKVYGEGEWKRKVHGASKRRTWKKLHLCIDDSSFYILDSDLTDTTGHDAESAIGFIRNLTINEQYDIASLKADGAYDTHRLYLEASRNLISAIIPPRETAKTLEEVYANPPPEESQRDKTIKSVRKLGLKEWKKGSGYHCRSKVETAMYRYKQIIGDKLKARLTETQHTEHKIACNILNQMTSLGMPRTVKV